jgi:hypothetical protein
MKRFPYFPRGAQPAPHEVELVESPGVRGKIPVTEHNIERIIALSEELEELTKRSKARWTTMTQPEKDELNRSIAVIAGQLEAYGDIQHEPTGARGGRTRSKRRPNRRKYSRKQRGRKKRKKRRRKTSIAKTRHRITAGVLDNPLYDKIPLLGANPLYSKNSYYDEDIERTASVWAQMALNPTDIVLPDTEGVLGEKAKRIGTMERRLSEKSQYTEDLGHLMEALAPRLLTHL